MNLQPRPHEPAAPLDFPSPVLPLSSAAARQRFLLGFWGGWRRGWRIKNRHRHHDSAFPDLNSIFGRLDHAQQHSPSSNLGAIREPEQRIPVGKGGTDKEEDAGAHQRKKETIKRGRDISNWQTQHLGISWRTPCAGVALLAPMVRQ